MNEIARAERRRIAEPRSAPSDGVVYDEALLTNPSRHTWTRSEACRALGISRAAFGRIAHDARIHYAKRGRGDYIFDARAILAALASEAEASR